jgi:hypothetical protein
MYFMADASATSALDGPAALAQADAQSLEELFSRDPFEMAAEDSAAQSAGTAPRNFPAIVAALRRQRSAWKIAETQGAKQGKAKAPKASVSLADLGLE